MYCRWLLTDTGGTTNCWQKGKALKKSECGPCLSAKSVQALTNNQAMKQAEWPKDK